MVYCPCNRSTIKDLVASEPEGAARDLKLLTGQSTLTGAAYYHPYIDKRLKAEICDPRGLAYSVPRDVASFKEILGRGVGPGTLRALALVA